MSVTLTEEQFTRLVHQRDEQHRELVKSLHSSTSQLVAAVVPATEVRIALARIEESVRNQSLLMSTLREEDVIKIAAAKASAEKAHQRVDDLGRVVGRLMAAGGFMNLALVVSVIVLLIKRG